MKIFYHPLYLFLIFFPLAELWSISLGDYLSVVELQGIYVDPHLKTVELEAETTNDLSKRLTTLSRSLPIRLVQDKGYLKVLPPFHREVDEHHAFRATVVFPESGITDEIRNKIYGMNGWFLRLQVEPSLRNGFRWIDLKMSHDFFLNQFHDDFNSLCFFLFGNQSFLKVKYLTQWIQWQRQLIWENYEGVLPDLTTLPNPNFKRSKRRGVLSTVQN